MAMTFSKRVAYVVFYGSLTALPTLVWVIANFYQHISYMVLSLLTVMPLYVFHTVRQIIEEPDPVVAQSAEAVAAVSDGSVPA